MTLSNDLTIEQIQENFEFLEEWKERFTYLIELGQSLPPMDDADKTEANKVHGCQALVHMKATLTESTPATLQLIASSDAHIVNGIIALMMIMYSGKQPAEILQINAEGALATMGLDQHLSPTRRNGMHSMIKRIRELATGYVNG